MNRLRLHLSVLTLCFTGAVHADGGVYILPYGAVVDRNGNIVSEGNTVSGEKGDSLVGKDGKIYSADDLKVNSRGKVVTRNGRAFEAEKRDPSPTAAYPNLSANYKGSSSTANARTTSAPVGGKSRAGSSGGSSGNEGAAANKPRRSFAGPGIEMVVGGSSENGVTRIGKLPIIP